MLKRYEKWMYDWETRLTMRDTNRVVRPFEWGAEWAERWPLVNGYRPAANDFNASEHYYRDLNARIVANSDEFFSYRTPTDFRLEKDEVRLIHTGSDPATAKREPMETQEGTFLRFTSSVETPHAENNRMNARWFPARGRRAIVVMPQWNADALSHNGLCRIFNLLGIAALRMSMPYHDVRMPAELSRADYAVSANIARTIDAARQGIADVRSCIDWLEQQGYTQFAVLGTSLGSCYAFITSAHDPRIRVNVFNHASTYFGDVVWTGQSTRHIRAGIEDVMTRERLREVWSAISPMSYFDKFTRWPKRSLMIYTKYDLTFLPELSKLAAAEFEKWGTETTVKCLPCGHYTLGETPYKFMDAWVISRFLARAFDA
jgi:dienelactone hydrolase